MLISELTGLNNNKKKVQQKNCDNILKNIYALEQMYG